MTPAPDPRVGPARWVAEMVTPAVDVTGPLFRREVSLDAGHGPVARALLHVTSLGVHEAFVDGEPVGPDVLSPGWSAYEWRLRYRTHDVTALLRDGSVLTVSVGNGWWRGRLGFMGGRALYGDRLGLLAQLEVTFADGHEQVVATDTTWTAGPSDILADDLYDGQTIDAGRRAARPYVAPRRRGAAVRHRSARPLPGAARGAPGGAPTAAGSGPLRVGARSSTSGRTSWAGSAAPCRGPGVRRCGSVMRRSSSTASSGCARCVTPRPPTASSSAVGSTGSSRPRRSTASATSR